MSLNQSSVRIVLVDEHDNNKILKEGDFPLDKKHRLNIKSLMDQW